MGVGVGVEVGGRGPARPRQLHTPQIDTGDSSGTHPGGPRVQVLQPCFGVCKYLLAGGAADLQRLHRHQTGK